MESAPATRSDITLTLPFELLCDIFSTLVHNDLARLLKRDSPSDESQLPYNGHIRGWFVVTHVCSRWRRIAIGQPALWTHVDVRLGADWVKRFIKRSRPLPITFEAFCEDATTGSPVATYNARRYGYYHSLARIREQVCRDTMRVYGDRMRQLDIRWGVNVRGHTVPSTIERSFPVLDTLLMRDCGLGLPLSEMFAFDAPGLRRLCVQDVTSFPWDLPSFSHLTHLVLECVSAFGFGGSGFFFDILRRNGALQQLCLGGVIPTQDHISERTVDLPHLSSLCLSGTADRVSTFRASLRTPALRSDELYAITHTPGSNPVSLSSLLGATLGNISASSFTHLSIIRNLVNYPESLLLRASQVEADSGPVRAAHQYPEVALDPLAWRYSESDHQGTAPPLILAYGRSLSER